MKYKILFFFLLTSLVYSQNIRIDQLKGTNFSRDSLDSYKAMFDTPKSGLWWTDNDTTAAIYFMELDTIGIRIWAKSHTQGKFTKLFEIDKTAQINSYGIAPLLNDSVSIGDSLHQFRDLTLSGELKTNTILMKELRKRADWQVLIDTGGGSHFDTMDVNNYFHINSLGQITKVDDTIADSVGQVLRADGTSFTPDSLKFMDLRGRIDTTQIPKINASKIGSGAITNTEFSYLSGATSNLQTQLDNKAVINDGLSSPDYTYSSDHIDLSFVSLTGSYSDPSWITSLASSKLTGGTSGKTYTWTFDDFNADTWVITIINGIITSVKKNGTEQ